MKEATQLVNTIMNGYGFPVLAVLILTLFCYGNPAATP